MKILCSIFISALILVLLSIDTNGQLVHKLQDKIKKVAAQNLGINVARYDHEEMMLFPNVGFRRKEGDWRLNLHGWRFQTSKKNKLLGESSSAAAQRLARLLATTEQLVYYNDTFQRERLKPFMVQDETNEKIHIMIGQKHNYSTRTDSDGQFRTSFIIPDADVQELKQSPNSETITYKAVGDNADLWEGKVHLLERNGLSVISDIDDTIKLSEVLDKMKLVANTFIHPFRVVEGMPEVYRGWKSRHNCSFHYLSAMPDQLYTMTKDFIDEQQFPDGTFHMRFRTLVLVGDSGERDPEIYGNLARLYPKRVRAIFIRAVKGEKPDDQRFHTAFRDVPREKWLVFTDPLKDLPKDLNSFKSEEKTTSQTSATPASTAKPKPKPKPKA